MRSGKSSQEPPFKAGDRVTTDYNKGAGHIVRTVTKVDESNKHASGWAVSADAGEPCQECGRHYTDVIWAVDSYWFKKVKEEWYDSRIKVQPSG